MGLVSSCWGLDTTPSSDQGYCWDALRLGFWCASRTKPRRFNESLTCPINEPDAAKEGSKFTPINEPNAAEEGSKFTPINEPGAAEEGSKFIPINEPGAAEEGSNATEFDSGVVVEESFGGDTKDGAVAKKL